MELEIRRGEDLFAQGKIHEAEDLFLALLKKAPDNPEILNDLGVLNHSLGRNREAERYLRKALELNPDYDDALANLKDMRGNPEGSNVDARAPRRALDSSATHCMEKMSQRILLCCLPGLDNFVDDLILALKPRLEITKLVSNQMDDFLNALPNCDVVWLEWGNQLAEALTRKAAPLLKGKKVICRIHSYEVLDGLADRLDFSVIDDLVFVAPHIRDILVQRRPNIPEQVGRIHILPNGVDLGRFSFYDRPRGFNIAYLGSINFKKGPMLLLHAFWDLVQKDSRYRLCIAGNYQDLRYRLYFDEMIQTMGLTRNIRMDGWVRDTSAWLQDKHFVLCTSVLEGHPVGVLEGMACGLKPVIHTFVGAKRLYPEKYLWKSIPEFVELITSNDFHPEEYRKYVEQSFSLETQLSSVERIICGTKHENALPDDGKRNSSHFDGTPQKKTRVRSDLAGFVSTEDSKRFYNGFLQHLKKDHLRPNPRHERTRQSMAKIIRPGMKVLDIGCGTGITSRFMAELGAHVTGIDLSDRLISYAKEKSSHPNVRYFVQDATKLSLGEVFDAITIVDCLEHIIPSGLDSFLKVIREHSSEQTIIYLNIPDSRFQRFMKKYHPERLQIIDEGYDPENLLARFRAMGYEASDIKIYGIDTPIQYNEYIFHHKAALDAMYRKAFERQSR